MFIHAVPFTVHLEHGFFNYQPNFFDALARYNSYETLGIWIGPDWQLASFIPWDPVLLDYLALSSKTTHLLVVAQRKMYDREFCVPFQEIYEGMVPDDVRSRYGMVVDGEVLDGRRVKYLTKEGILAQEYQTQIMGLNNVIDSYKGQVDELKHELAMTKHQLDQLRYGLSSAECASLSKRRDGERLKHRVPQRPTDVTDELLRRMRSRMREGKLERENLDGDAKGKGISDSNREAESTDAPARGGLLRSKTFATKSAHGGSKDAKK